MKELDVRGRADRRLSAFKTRMRAWTDARKKAIAGVGDDPDVKPAIAVSPKLSDAILTVAPERIEQLVRANKPFAPDKLTDSDFEDLASTWLADANLKLRFDDLTPAAVDKPIAEWQADRKKKPAATKPPPKKK
jgi:hypothetical protein